MVATGLVVALGALAQSESVRAQEGANICEGVTCAGHGMCVPYEGQPACVCDPGYMPDPNDELSCVVDPEAPPQPETQPPAEPPPAAPPQAPLDQVPPPEMPEARPDPVPAAPETVPPGEPVGDPGEEHPDAAPHEPVPEPSPEPMGPATPMPAEPEPTVEAPPPAPTVPVTFSSSWGRQRIAVTYGDERVECLTPCTVELPPGQSAEVGPAEGRWSPNVTIEVPAAATLATIERHGGRGLRIGGGVSLGLGVALMAGGLALAAVQSDVDDNAWSGGVYAMVLPGAAGLIAGIILLAISPESYRIDLAARPPETDEAEAEPAAPTTSRLRLRALGFAPTPGGGALGAAFSF